VLRQLLAEFLERDSQARRLVRQLQVDEPDESRRAPKTYLPYIQHPRFDLLGEDFVSVLSLKAPEHDKLLWLVPLSALHLSIYHAEVAYERIKADVGPLPMLCEIVAPRKTVVRQLSVESLTENSDLARRAVDLHLKTVFASADWKRILDAPEVPAAEKMEMACAFLRAALRPLPRVIEEQRASGDLGVLQDEVTRYFLDRHNREFSRVHFTYGREAGLVSKRATNRYRYAPTDQLLQSLVLANVEHERPLEEFLDLLFRRYGIVVGPRQQGLLEEWGHHDLGKAVSSQAFRHNQIRLEARLKSMGMLRRLSDSQAYALNPL